MFKIYLLVALRKLAKEKLYVTINILSLAIGIGSFLILESPIMMWGLGLFLKLITLYNSEFNFWADSNFAFSEIFCEILK